MFSSSVKGRLSGKTHSFFIGMTCFLLSAACANEPLKSKSALSSPVKNDANIAQDTVFTPLSEHETLSALQEVESKPNLVTKFSESILFIADTAKAVSWIFDEATEKKEEIKPSVTVEPGVTLIPLPERQFWMLVDDEVVRGGLDPDERIGKVLPPAETRVNGRSSYGRLIKNGEKLKILGVTPYQLFGKLGSKVLVFTSKGNNVELTEMAFGTRIAPESVLAAGSPGKSLQDGVWFASSDRAVFIKQASGRLEALTLRFSLSAPPSPLDGMGAFIAPKVTLDIGTSGSTTYAFHGHIFTLSDGKIMKAKPN